MQLIIGSTTRWPKVVEIADQETADRLGYGNVFRSLTAQTAPVCLVPIDRPGSGRRFAKRQPRKLGRAG